MGSNSIRFVLGVNPDSKSVLSGFVLTSTRASVVVRIKTQQETIAEQVYNKLEVAVRLPKFLGKSIDKISEKRVEVPQNIWVLVKDNLKYEVFKASVVNILNENFSTSELEQMIVDYQDYQSIPIRSLKVRNEIFLAIKDFRGSILNQINNTLSLHGYQKINE